MSTRQYEALSILHPHLGEEALAETVNKMEESIKSLGGSIERTEKQGRRKIAFTVKKLNDGYFVLTYFSLPSEKIIDLKKAYKLNENIIRSLVSKKVG